MIHCKDGLNIVSNKQRITCFLKLKTPGSPDINRQARIASSCNNIFMPRRNTEWKVEHSILHKNINRRLSLLYSPYYDA